MPRLRTSLLLVLVACLKSNDVTVRTSPIDDRSPEDTGDDYEFQHLTTEGYVAQKPGFYAVHNDGDWQSVWTSSPELTRPPIPASVDFKTHMLFVATSKSDGAKSIEVQKITRTADGLHIYVLETLPLASCPPEPRKAKYPIDVVSLDSVPYDMHVVYDRVHADSCGPPPDAIVQCRIAGSGSAGSEKITASPGENIDCDSSQSKAQVGQISSRSWQLNALPPGSATKLTLGKENIGVTFPVDAWGIYQLGLDVRDATREGDGLGLVEVLPPGTWASKAFIGRTLHDPIRRSSRGSNFTSSRSERLWDRQATARSTRKNLGASFTTISATALELSTSNT